MNSILLSICIVSISERVENMWAEYSEHLALLVRDETFVPVRISSRQVGSLRCERLAKGLSLSVEMEISGGSVVAPLSGFLLGLSPSGPLGEVWR